MSVSPGDIITLQDSAARLLQQHRLIEARPLYVEICEALPDDADAWLMLGAIDEQLGLLDDAIEYLRNAIARAPGMAEAYLTLASVLWRKGQVAGAIATLQQACQLAPDYLQAWHRLGRMQLESGDAASSLDSFAHASTLTTEPAEIAELTSGRVEALVESGQFDGALELCSLLDAGQRCYWTGMIHLAGADKEAAIREFSRVTADCHWHISACWHLARLSAHQVDEDLQRDYLQWYFDHLAPVYDFHLQQVPEEQQTAVPVELIRQYLADNANVLDLGCGNGRIGRLVRRQDDYTVGVDLSQRMLDYAAMQGGYDLLVHADILSSGTPGDKYALVILANVLQWSTEPALMLRTAMDYVSEDGMLLVLQDSASALSDNVLHGLNDITDAVQLLIDTDEHRVLHTSLNQSAGHLWLVGNPGTAERIVDDCAGNNDRREGLNQFFKGIANFHQKKHSKAQSHLELALAASPDSTDTLFQLGLLAQEQGRQDEALDFYQRVLDAEPDNIVTLFQVGTVHQAREDYDKAIDAYRQAAELGAKLWVLYNNLGWVLRQQKDIQASRRAFLTALYHDPVNRMVLSNLQSLEDEESGTEPRKELELTLEEVAGSDADMLLGFAVALREREFYQRAISLIRQALTLKPDFHDAKMQLALALQKSGDVGGAIELFNELLDEYPNKAAVYDNLAGAVAACDDIEKACLMWEKGSQVSDPWAGTHSNRLFMYNYSPKAGREILASAHLGWGNVIEQALGPVPAQYENSPDPERKLRIGYVSADFYGHSVSHFLEPVLASHDHNRVEVFCYANNEKEDPQTQRHRYYADHWRRINGKDDEAVIQRIQDDEIDILVDLTGHTGGSRLPIFVRKPAPIQVSWLGYPNTTGLSRIDYRITDEWADPDGMTESLHSEQLYRLPEGFLCYKPIEFAPAVEVSRGRKSTFTFGCFNNLYKLTPEVIRVWSRILKALPESTLLLKSFGFNADCVYQRYTRLFTDNGIDPDRIHMMGRLGTREHLALYNQMDIVLDPFPYNGTTTTCEALWMGVPVIALAGDRHAARVSVSLLSVTGCEELIAESEDEYVQKAIDLAQDRDRLVAYKSTLRHRMKNSPLTDGVGFTHQLEEAYREMWRDWCSSQEKRKASHTAVADGTNS